MTAWVGLNFLIYLKGLKQHFAGNMVPRRVKIPSASQCTSNLLAAAESVPDVHADGAGRQGVRHEALRPHLTDTLVEHLRVIVARRYANLGAAYHIMQGTLRCSVWQPESPLELQIKGPAVQGSSVSVQALIVAMLGADIATKDIYSRRR